MGRWEIKTVLPAIPESYERCCHEFGIASFYLDLRQLSSFGLEELAVTGWSVQFA